LDHRNRVGRREGILEAPFERLFEPLAVRVAVRFLVRFAVIPPRPDVGGAQPWGVGQAIICVRHDVVLLQPRLSPTE